MKFLFDANLSPRLCEQLSDLYPQSSHVESFGLQADDREVWAKARELGAVIVTKDSDFSEMALVLGPPPKVVQIRLGNCRTALVESLLRQRFHGIQEFVLDPALALLAIP